MRLCLILILLSHGWLSIAARTGNITSVVKIFAVRSAPSFFQPWRNYQQSSSTGSGFVIADGKIITNAHLVANQTFLQVRKQGDPRRYTARLIAVGHECDLAILKVDDPEFYRDMPPLELGELPELQDKVTVLGYPVGGDNISVTEGVISRIEPVAYNHTGRRLLATQIDAALNPGNSGGPVIKEDKVVGVAFQGLSQSQNIGYMIPLPVLRHFLNDVADGQYDGFPQLDFAFIKMENPDMREWAGMRREETGILITRLSATETRRGFLQENDVLLEIDGIRIANDATVPFRKNEVIFFETMIWDKYIGDTVRLKILRKGEYIEIDYPVTARSQLVPLRTFDVLPTYYLIGGLLFLPLNVNFLDSWNNWWANAPRHLSYIAAFGDIDDERDQVVVLSEVLADETNQGYQHINYQIVTELNGRKVRNIRDLIDRLEQLEYGFIELKLLDNQSIILDVEKCRQATPVIMERYRIPADRSPDLLSAESGGAATDDADDGDTPSS